MSSESPASVLYSSDGTELAVVQNAAIPAGTRGILIDGTDGTDARTLLTDAAGRLYVNQGTPNTIANPWPVVLADGYGNLFGEPNNPLSVTGSIMVANPSVGVVPGAAPADATYVGALVNTATPSGYTNGNMYPFSLTTTGLLRVDGSNVTQPVSGTVAVTQSTSPWVVSGTVTSNQGAPNTLINAWPVELTDGYGNLFGEVNNPLYITASSTSPLPVVTNKAATSSVTSVASSATNTTLLAANSNRVFASIYNESSKTVFIKLGTTASATSYSILLMPNSYWEVPSDYTGKIDAIWSSANGNARITELSP